MTREIFQLSNKSLLCLRTPCSGDFEAEAIAIGEKIGLPLRWMDVDLQQLDRVLREAMSHRQLIEDSKNQGMTA